MSIRIPVYRPSLRGNERKYVNECLDSSWISSKGEYIGRFEEHFSRYVGADFSVSTCNGTVALHLALVTLGVGPGDEVIVPTLTYIASVNSIAYTGATPVFVDSTASDWQIDPADVKAKITPRTKAIMVVHLYGHPCDMDALTAIAKEHGLFLVEDCAEALGTLYKGRHVGTFGDISTFSFFGNKTITTGEGGMVVTNDPTLFNRALQFRGQGLAQYRQYWHDIIGYNYRMTNICAAIGMAQLEQADIFLSKKRQIVDWYIGHLGDRVEHHGEMPGCRHSYWMFTILVSAMEKRDELRGRLADAGVETRPMFYPVHTMPMYSKKFMRHPVAEGLAWRGINLPSFPDLTEEDVAYISGIIMKFS